ncbi:hypothetical protein PInf_020161 [Phytophthora infestans]|nr:hypothetical protein PInf_020161 [Phytophthora infestans]
MVYGPVTRARSDIETHAPLKRNAIYYEQRASAGLIVTEACAISEQAFGWYGSPALYTDERIRMVRQCYVCDCSESRQAGWMCEHIVATMALLEKISIDALLSVLPVRRRPRGQFKSRGALARTRFNKSDARFFGVSHLEQLFMESPAAPTHWHVTKEFSVKNRGQVLREHVPGHVDRWLENGGRYQWKVKFSTGKVELMDVEQLAVAVAYSHSLVSSPPDEQVQGWKEVVDCVHKKGGKIFVQLWHMDRQSHPSFHTNNEVVSSSATLYETGRTRNVYGEHVGYERSRALTLNEIPEVVEQWRSCAERAKEAGFDGIELHAARGYLIDQFLQSCTNQRTDSHGGSFESRYRFLNDVIEAVKTVYPADRIGARTYAELFTYAYERLSEHGLAYLAILDGLEGVGADAHYHDKCRPLITFDAKKAFKGTVIANKGYSRDIAEGVLRSGSADLVGFARMFMANPDLVDRFKNGWPLTPLMDYEFFWDPVKGDEGYTTLSTSSRKRS